MDDNTAEHGGDHRAGGVRRVVATRRIDALYAFTDCEVSISPNACVIRDEKPHFMGVSEILRRSADHTQVRCWGSELEIRFA